MLKLLVKYAEGHGLKPEPGFAVESARWGIVCDEHGRFLQVIELGDTERKRNPGREFPKAPKMSFSDLTRGGESKCHFLIESAQVVTMLSKGNEDEKAVARARSKHDYFVRLLRRSSAVMPELGFFAELLGDTNVLGRINAQLKEHKAKPSDKVTLAIHGRKSPFLVESDRWHEWWRTFRKNLHTPSTGSSRARKKGAVQMRCFVTGELVEPIRVQPKIKGLANVGGLVAGDALASFKQDSFCSYGLKQALNSPMSEQAATAYCAALNDLLRSTGRRLVGAKVLHWFRKRVPP